MGVSILFSMFEQYILTHYEIRSAWSTPKALYFISRYYPIFYLMCAIENISDTIKCDVLIIHMVGFYFMVRSCVLRDVHTSDSSAVRNLTDASSKVRVIGLSLLRHEDLT